MGDIYTLRWVVRAVGDSVTLAKRANRRTGGGSACCFSFFGWSKLQTIECLKDRKRLPKLPPQILHSPSNVEGEAQCRRQMLFEVLDNDSMSTSK
ncbi:hypothetical protein VTN77DRAFT_3518 [Rasamsonia byssochlamydoides]|uniref:uncharacterized protein n=1 Tax=Rasamsonia byssochlamydoides TaxID=89139 RepID=UPI003743DBEA